MWSTPGLLWGSDEGTGLGCILKPLCCTCRADAPVIGHMWEWSMHEEFKIGYDDVTGKCKAIPQAKHDFKKPLRLRFEINEEALETMQDVISDVDDLIDDLDLVLIKHDAYSKGFIKTCKMSPDAYIQAALQLAYLWVGLGGGSFAPPAANVSRILISICDVGGVHNRTVASLARHTSRR